MSEMAIPREPGTDFEGLVRGWYTDTPFLNTAALLSRLATQRYTFRGQSRVHTEGVDLSSFCPGDVQAETHWIARRAPYTVLVGVRRCHAILRQCTGYLAEGSFINTAQHLCVRSLQDGDIMEYTGRPSEALPMMTVTGRLRDFLHLKTPLLGILARASRIATNVYRALVAANGKPVYFFPARFDPPEVQEMDGYAYHVALSTFNRAHGCSLKITVPTEAHAALWGDPIEGTIPHEALACFLGDTAELMIKLAEMLPTDRVRVALVDFTNDCVAETRAVLRAMFDRFLTCSKANQPELAQKFVLSGIRVDTSRELIDASLAAGADASDYGPCPRLIRLLRGTIDDAWQEWGLPPTYHNIARQYCRDVRIVVTGGFSEKRIAAFESQNAPVDAYGVGAALFSNIDDENSVTDFSSFIARLRIADTWVDVAKSGRCINSNPQLQPVLL
jgi:nicotinate phosphoribosyltransferase